MVAIVSAISEFASLTFFYVYFLSFHFVPHGDAYVLSSQWKHWSFLCESGGNTFLHSIWSSPFLLSFKSFVQVSILK